LGQENGESKTKGRRIPSWLPQVVGYALSLGCLAWVLHGYDLREIKNEIKDLDWAWVSLCVIFDLSVYVCHGWRWNVVLSPIRRPPFWRTVQAIYIGLFANEVLPLRTGEVIRCYLLAHWNRLYLSTVLASAAIERLMDGVWMVIAFLITAGFLKLPRGIVDVVRVLSVLLLLGIAILLFVIFHKHHAHAVVRESRWAATLRHVVDGLHLMGNWPTLGKAMIVSLLYLILQMLTVWALMKADRLDLSVWAAAAVIVIVRFGTVIPNAPGNLGLFQAVCTLALMLFDVEKDVAKTFSFLMFFALTLPLLIGGAVAVALTGLNLADIRTRARRGLAAAQHQPAPGDQTPAL
jgi:glycosyltransferase 2 family protein